MHAVGGKGYEHHSEPEQKERSALGGPDRSVRRVGRQFLEDNGDNAQETPAHRKPQATLTIFFHFILRF